MAKRILSVDDDHSVQDLVSMHLLLQGFEVKTAVDGEEAISILANEPFDLVLLDIEMPKVDGLEVLRYIKTHHIDVRIIMLTGADNLPALNECAKLGAFDYLPKPYNFHELMDSIDRLLADIDSPLPASEHLL